MWVATLCPGIHTSVCDKKSGSDNICGHRRMLHDSVVRAASSTNVKTLFHLRLQRHREGVRGGLPDSRQATWCETVRKNQSEADLTLTLNFLFHRIHGYIQTAFTIQLRSQSHMPGQPKTRHLGFADDSRNICCLVWLRSNVINQHGDHGASGHNFESSRGYSDRERGVEDYWHSTWSVVKSFTSEVRR